MLSLPLPLLATSSPAVAHQRNPCITTFATTHRTNCCDQNEKEAAKSASRGGAKADPHLAAFCTIVAACTMRRIFLARRRPLSPRLHFCSFNAEACRWCTTSSSALLACRAWRPHLFGRRGYNEHHPKEKTFRWFCPICAVLLQTAAAGQAPLAARACGDTPRRKNPRQIKPTHGRYRFDRMPQRALLKHPAQLAVGESACAAQIASTPWTDCAQDVRGTTDRNHTDGPLPT